MINQQEFKLIKIENPCRPHFYHIQKIHKNIEQLPGRPMISGINSLTCNMSQYLDLYLQEYVWDLPSFVKDSNTVIRSFGQLHRHRKDQSTNSRYTIIALYSNIDHQLGKNAVDTFLKAYAEDPEVQQHFFLDSLRFILENNLFTTNPYTGNGGVKWWGPEWPHHTITCLWVFLKKNAYIPHINIRRA